MLGYAWCPPPTSPRLRRKRTGEPLLRVIGTFGLAAAIINITIGGGIFRLPANVAGSLGAAAPHRVSGLRRRDGADRLLHR